MNIAFDRSRRSPGGLAGIEGRPGRRAHRRGDIMVIERDAVASDRIEAWQIIIGRRRELVGSLIDDHEDDIVGRFGFLARASEQTFLGLHGGASEKRDQTHAGQEPQATVETFAHHSDPLCAGDGA